MEEETTAAKQKVVFILIDGLGDVSLPSLGNKTTLEHADVPHMDGLAAGGLNGLLDPVEVGLACGSDTAHLSILGYPPRTYYRGRGAYETMGAGLDMIPGDIAFKSNFATMDENGIVTSRRADRLFEEWGPPLCTDLTGIQIPGFPEHEVTVVYVHRGLLMRNQVTSTDPLKDNLPLEKSQPLEDGPNARLTSDLINALSEAFHKALSVHPLNIERQQKGLSVANVILLRGCGVRQDVEPFEKRHGLKPFMIAPTCIIRGLGMSLNIDIKEAEGATGDYRTNLLAKGRVAVDTICNKEEDYSFGFIHIKAVDDASHDKNVKLKVDFIEKADKMLAQVLKELVEAEEKEEGKVAYNIVLTGDHSTPVLYGDHSCEPVPFVIAKARDAWNAVQGNGVKSAVKEETNDKVQRFDEVSAGEGFLGRFPGDQVMPLILRFLEWQADHSSYSS
ncbi:Metalloenzyme domain-containing protein [Balamuthia mandrillaris]